VIPIRNMKILITIIGKRKTFDRMIHLGDAEGYEDYIAELAGCPLDIVARK